VTRSEISTSIQYQEEVRLIFGNRILGVDYDIEGFNFIQISQDLPKVTGIEGKNTVPIIKAPEGEYIMDSEIIAQWVSASSVVLTIESDTDSFAW
jgi:glutathione S-transferase